MAPRTKGCTLQITLPIEVATRLLQDADRNYRNLSQEVLYRVTQAWSHESKPMAQVFTLPMQQG